MIFTRHAYERYRQFHMLDQPTATDEDARQILQRFGPTAIYTGRKTHLGDPIWCIEALGVELVAKNENGTVTCVTVLPPQRLRGLTPLQAEAVEVSMRAAEARFAAVDRERRELRAQAPAIGEKPADPASETRRCRRLTDLNPLAKIRQAERDVLSAVLKTMRTQLSADSSLANAKAALKIALRHLRVIGAVDVIDVIREIDPGLTSDKFIDGAGSS